MRTVYKYSLPEPAIVGTFEMVVPYGAEIVSFGRQGIHYCIWAEVNTTARMRTINLRIVGTGDEVPTGSFYIATLHEVVMGIDLVWHLYQVN